MFQKGKARAMRGLPQVLCKYVYFYANFQSTVCLVRGGKSGKFGYKPEHKPAILSAPALFSGKGLPWMLCRGRSGMLGWGITSLLVQVFGVGAAGPWDGRGR